MLSRESKRPITVVALINILFLENSSSKNTINAVIKTIISGIKTPKFGTPTAETSCSIIDIPYPPINFERMESEVVFIRSTHHLG